MKLRIFVSILLVVAIFGQTSQVLAATYTVPCKTDQLINAIAVANSTSTDDTINLKARCTYTLVSVHNSTLGATGLPVIADAAIAGKLTINGNGATIERSKGKRTPEFRILTVANGGDLTINNVTLRNGKLLADIIDSNGGGITSYGALTVINSTITGNSAEYGGGIVSYNGPLTVNNSLFNGNTSTKDGAGINSTGKMDVTLSTFSGNIAQGLGGGILVAEGKATVTDSTFSGNVANGPAGGGGILNGGFGPSDLTVLRSTFTNNTGNGGALFNTLSGTMTVTNSTISGNQAGWGGGISNAGILTIIHSTITGNTADNDGGGIFNNDGPMGTVTLGHTIVSGNTASSGPDIFGSINSLGYNIIGTPPFLPITGDTTGNLIGAAASPLNLGPLQDNGGPTQTIALGAGSVAINTGYPAFVPPPDFDQRGAGFPRLVGGRIDIGAYESNP